MDAVMHFFGSAAVSANFGEWPADLLVGPLVEVGDMLKALVRGENLIGENGWSSHDIEWNRRGTELQNALYGDALNECRCRKLAEKFANGTFTISNYNAWYKKPSAKRHKSCPFS